MYSKESTKVMSSNIPFSANNYHTIMENGSAERKMAYIDGGNAVILETPNICVQFIRLYFNIFKNGRKINSGKHEFFSLTTSECAHAHLLFKTKLFAINNSLVPNEADIQFDPNDPSKGVRKLPGKEPIPRRKLP